MVLIVFTVMIFAIIISHKDKMSSMSTFSNRFFILFELEKTLSNEH